MVRLFMDVDLAVPVKTIGRFVEATQNADVVIGSRSIEGAERSGEPLSRRIGGRVVGRVTKMILGLSVSDTQCGFKAFRAEAAERLLFEGAAGGRLRVRCGDPVPGAAMGDAGGGDAGHVELRRDEHRPPPPRSANAGGDCANTAAGDAVASCDVGARGVRGAATPGQLHSAKKIPLLLDSW